MRISSAATRTRASLHGNAQPRTLDLARDVMQLHMVLVPLGRNPPAGNYSLLPDPAPHVQAAMTSLAHKKKNKPRNPRDSPREHMCPRT